MWPFRTDPGRKEREHLLHAAGITREDGPDWRTLMRLDPKDWEITRWYPSEAAYGEDRQRLSNLGWRVEEEDRGAYVTRVPTTQSRGGGAHYAVSVTYKYIRPAPAEAQAKEFWQ